MSLTLDEALGALPVVAILRGVRPDEVADVSQALFDAGIRLIEVPLNSPEPLTSIETLAKRFAGTALVGAGTVLTPAQVDQVADVGGQIIVSPNTNADVIRRSKARGLVSMPGFFTPSEAFTAVEAGADCLKLFPAELAGPAAIKALRAVLPAQTRLLVVGGVNPGNIAAYIEAGAGGFGIGSDLFKPGRSAAETGERARALVSAVNVALGR